MKRLVSSCLALAVGLMSVSAQARVSLPAVVSAPKPVFGGLVAGTPLISISPVSSFFAAPGLIPSKRATPLELLRAAASPDLAPRAGEAFDGSVQAAEPLRLIIAGAPGSGKGEASKALVKDYGLVHISAGELLRAYAKADPIIEAAMNLGKLVSAELVVRLVRERLSQPDVAQRGFVLDGFPRRMVEAKAFQAELAAGRIAVDAVIVLDVPEDELLRRILARGRADDSEKVFRRRMGIYRRSTVPAIEHLTRRLPALRPDVASTSGVAASYARIKRAIENFLSYRRR